MSRVFVAREIALDRQIVIKFLPPEIAAEANRDRFRREIQMAAKLSHPHIAPLFASAEEGELLYYTMPFIAGESLRQTLDSGKRLGMNQINEILVDVADALAYAHRHGIVHRDIKPANILREGDHAVITDFGVAKAMSAALGHGSGDRTATTSGLAFGTPAYMAPEQIAGDSSADHRVDIYAFGLLAYELLTGRAPFRSDSPQAVLAAQLTQAPDPILPLRGDTPPVLAALVTRCLEKDAARRPPTAEAVLEVLRSISAASGASHYKNAEDRKRASRGGLIAVGALVVAAAIWLVADRSTIFKSATPPADTIPKVDTALLRAQSAAAKAESTLAALETARVRDSVKRSEERAAKQDQRLIALLRDSISNALQRAQAESVAKAKDAELALARQQDSINRAKRRVFMPSSPISLALAPEAFAARSTNLGPPRRIAVSIQSGLRNPTAVAAAVVLRDSLDARLKSKTRYLLVPNDSVSEALQRSRNIDSLRTWLHGDMWVTINANVEMAADSLRWTLDLRDFTAHSSYAHMTSASGRVGLVTASEAATVSKLVDNVVRLLESMDRAPRK
jgi:serine/threonine protein kinase